jgi:hypothetical protein
VRHPWLDLLSQRIFGIAGGYPDANDAAGLAVDPFHAPASACLDGGFATPVLFDDLEA